MVATKTASDTELVGSLVSLMHVLQDLYAETSRPLDQNGSLESGGR